MTTAALIKGKHSVSEVQSIIAMEGHGVHTDIVLETGTEATGSELRHTLGVD